MKNHFGSLSIWWTRRFSEFGWVLLFMTTIIAWPQTIKLGDPFPEISLPEVRDGQPMSVTDFRGRKVLLHVFASW